MLHSNQLFHIAQQFFPGGVNSPVRAFGGVGGEPFFVRCGKGPYLVDVEGREYIDYVCSWGAALLGHAPPEVVQAISQTAQAGVSFGIPTMLEIKLAEQIRKCLPMMESMRFVNSGTEAVMSAIRLARGWTKREKIIKFSSGYHGHVDSLLVQAGSGCLTFGIPSSGGVPKGLAEQTLIAEFNCLETVEQLFEHYPHDIAGIIVEPVAGNMNCILPVPGFLKGLRELCDHYQSTLIFDEVMTGFRVALGGAQSYYGITPDLITIGKVIGGGLPVGAFGGKREIMQLLAPVGPVYQAGTFSGNPVTMAAGLATLALVMTPSFYDDLSAKTAQLMTGLTDCAQRANVPFQAVSIGGLFGFYFTQKTPIVLASDVKQCDVATFKRFFHQMLKQGVYFAPSAFEAGFMSAAHGKIEIEKTLQAAAYAFLHCT